MPYGDPDWQPGALNYMEIDSHMAAFSCKWCQKTMGLKWKLMEIYKSKWALISPY